MECLINVVLNRLELVDRAHSDDLSYKVGKASEVGLCQRESINCPCSA
jgi:hypothetical protein